MNANPLQLIDRLLSHGVPLVIIGGHAVNCYGYVRATEDTDIIFQRTEASSKTLFQALDSINAFWISDEIDQATRLEQTVPVTQEFVDSQHLMMLGTDLGYVDIFDYIPGVAELPIATAFENVTIVDGRPYVSLDLLRQMKKASGRLKDLLDLENLPDDHS
ncbi:MAG: hypothetical protein KDB00_29545 [Planctomycetales bacterium]|nr:hypothetical protein [Planctomycetales bacterium]